MCDLCVFFFVFQAEDGIRDLVRSRGLGDVYKRQDFNTDLSLYYGSYLNFNLKQNTSASQTNESDVMLPVSYTHLTLPTSDLV